MTTQAHLQLDTMKPDDISVLLSDPDRYGTMDDRELERLTFAAIRLMTMLPEPPVAAKVAPLFSLYQARVPLPCREAMYDALFDLVKAGTLGFHALEPFLFGEEDHRLLSRVALDYACVVPLGNSDPLTGARFVLELFRTRQGDQVRSALFAGLLLLGDRRVTRLLWEARDELEPEELLRVSHTQSEYLYAATIWFWVRFLEELDGDETDARFGAVASTLCRAPAEASPRKVFDIRRDFPLTESAQPIEVLGKWPLEAYAAIIVPRLRAVEAREPEPKIMPQVLEAWRFPREDEPKKPAHVDPAVAPAARLTEVSRLMDRGQWKEALAIAQELCRIAPQDHRPFLDAAFCLQRLDCVRQARELLLSGPWALVNDPIFHYNMACYDALLGDLDSARTHLEEAIALKPNLAEDAREDPDLRALNDQRKQESQ